MTRGPGTFKQHDVKKALKGAIAAGVKIGRCEIDRNGTITVIPANDDAGPNGTASKLDDWRDVT